MMPLIQLPCYLQYCSEGNNLIQRLQGFILRNMCQGSGSKGVALCAFPLWHDGKGLQGACMVP